jgi:excisionase family DNA binding protein
LTLHEAAERLGVHYMTAYRYVRHGQLSATKVGGSWQVEADELARFQQGAPEQAAGGRAGRSRRVRWDERLEARLMAGDERGSWGVIESAMAAGHSVEEIYTQILSSAMVSIGARWENGDVDIAVEHRATAIAMRLIGRLGPRCVRRGRSRGTIVVGAPTGETHSLPGAILADLLRSLGWDVVDLGSDTPATSFGRSAADLADVVAVGVSVTHGDHLDQVVSIVDAVHELAPGVLVIVGGAAVSDEATARGLGADGWATSAQSFTELVETHRRQANKCSII